MIALAERLDAPVLTTFKAKGLVPDTHPLGAGVLGRSGTPVASWLMNESDLLDRRRRVVLQPHRHRGVQADRADRRRRRRDRPVRRGHRQRARATRRSPLAALTDARRRRRRPRTSAPTSPSGGRSGARRRHAESPTTAAAGSRPPPSSTRCREHLPADAVVTVDVGNHAYSLGRYLESKGQPVLMSGYLGSIGFGYPAALGAWAAAPDTADRRGHRRRRLRPVRHRADDRGQVRHPDQARPARQQRARQDQQGAARGRLPGLAHLAAQPRLGRVRRAVRRHRHPRRRTATSSTTPCASCSPPTAQPCSASSRTPNFSDRPPPTLT